MSTVYDAYTHQISFEGSPRECTQWLLNQGDTVGDRLIYRTWTENGNTYYDFGNLFIYNDEFITR